MKGNKGCTSGANERLRNRWAARQGVLETKEMKKARIVSNFFFAWVFMGMVCPQASHMPKHIRVSASKVLPTAEEEIKEQLSQLGICPCSQMVCTQG